MPGPGRHSLIALIAIAVMVLGTAATRRTADRAAAAEVDRIRIHLAGALSLLESRDLATLSPNQRANRARAIERLRKYRARGVFPTNDRFPDQRVPFFRDRVGTLCAVGHLLAASGRDDIVDRIAQRRNNARIKELVDEPGLGDWLDEQGLTVAEAARIQPTYGPIKDPNRISTAYGVGSAIAISVSVVTLSANLPVLGGGRPRFGWGLLGLAAGFGTAMLGVSRLDDEKEARLLGIANVAVGGAAAIIGVGALASKRPGGSDKIRLSPTVDWTRGGAAGLALSIRF